METWEQEIERELKLKAQAKEQIEKFQATLLLAGFKVKRHHELVNGYVGWSRIPYYPWYLFETDAGLIKIGWRKRVINLDWESTGLIWKRPVDEDVTYGETYCHAYGYDKLLEYLKLLRSALEIK